MAVVYRQVILQKVKVSAVVAVHTDSYSSREWCRREIIEAKRWNVPLVVANCIHDLDERSFPYLGNVPVVRMDPDAADRTEGKAILKALQEIVVEQQLTAFLETQAPCPHCGKRRRSKGYHTTQLRTIFGTITVTSPRLHQCPCQSQPTKTCSPLAELLPEHITPELLCLETKWAA